MPEINNVNNVRSIDTKKITSKLSFEIGEVFQARVVEGVKQGNEVSLRMPDGWQFTAMTKSPMEVNPEGLVKFKVVGYEDGKLQVIIVPTEIDGNSIEEKSIETILKQQNLDSSKKDIEIFKNMIKHDIPLTKDNISYVKTIMDFKEKMDSNEDGENVFISKYIQSKGIGLNSKEGKQIAEILKGFFKELKQASLEDILTLKENGLDLTEANLKSFNKVFKGDITLYKEFADIANNNIDTSGKATDKSFIEMEGNQVKNTDNNVKILTDLKEKIIADGSKKQIFINKFVEENGIALDSDKGKELIKNINEFLGEVKNEPIKGTIEIMQNAQEVIEPDSERMILPKNIESEMIEKVVINSDAQSNELRSSEEFKIVKGMVDNSIPLTKENVNNVKTLIDLKEKILSDASKKEALINKFVEKNGVSLDSDKGKELVKNINEFLSAVKNEPMKEIVERMQRAPEVIGTDSEGKILPKNIKENLPIIKGIIKDILSTEEFSKNQELTKSNQLSQNIKNEIAQKTDLMKSIINSIKEGDWSLLKNNINDIKVFNSMSNQYYYMDVPLNISQDQYECKLLIKDERKKGKKIDSKNVKMVISVKTINIGKVDAFIKVQERNISIDLKCNDEWVKVLQSENKKLYDTLQQLNYNVTIKVEKRVDETNIVTTRDFFQDNTIGSINTIV